MPKRRFGLKPGLGIYRIDSNIGPEGAFWEAPAEYGPIAASVFNEMFPAAKGIPRDPRVRAWKKKVMEAGWNAAIRLIRRGMNPADAFRKGLTTAYRTIPKPGRGIRRRYAY